MNSFELEGELQELIKNVEEVKSKLAPIERHCTSLASKSIAFKDNDGNLAREAQRLTRDFKAFGNRLVALKNRQIDERGYKL